MGEFISAKVTIKNECSLYHTTQNVCQPFTLGKFLFSIILLFLHTPNMQHNLMLKGIKKHVGCSASDNSQLFELINIFP